MKSVEAKIWDNDEELNRLLKLRDQTDRISNKDQHKILTKKIRTRFDQLRNLFYKAEADKIHETHEARNLEKLFRLAKNTTSHKRPTEKSCPGLKEHFFNHFSHPDPATGTPNQIRNPADFISRLKASGIVSDEELENNVCTPPSANEIITCIKNLKNKRAYTDIPPEFLRAVSDCTNYIKMIESMFAEIWNDMIIPDEWRKTTITALYKNKGSRKECKNYRGISIGSSFLKLAMAIIIERIKPWYNDQLLPNQNGFRQFFGCPDAIFALKSIQHISSRLNQETYILFVDLTAAYDWCVRTWLFQSIFNRIDDNNINTYTSIRIMEELYKHTLSNLKDDPDYFQTTSGVRQGGTESPVLFNLFMDYIMQIYNHQAEEQGLGVSFKYRIKDQARKRGETNYRGKGDYFWLGYADDLAIPATTKENLQIATNLLDELFTSFGLTISLDKTQSMIMNSKAMFILKVLCLLMDPQ